VIRLAAHTGVGTDDYKGHILGPNYAIQGNILLGPEILDSMEARFLREEGDLSCKLMAAMQGANVVGADTRCSSNGTSSLFAFVKVASINDVMGSPSFEASVRTNDNDQIEPIDSLQTLVNELIMCNLSDIEETIDFKEYFTVFPNPATSSLNIKVLRTGNYNLEFVNQSGKTILTDKISTDDSIDVSRMEAGIYFLKLSSESVTVTQEVLIK